MVADMCGHVFKLSSATNSAKELLCSASQSSLQIGAMISGKGSKDYSTSITFQ